VTTVKKIAGGIRGGISLQHLAQDIRYGLRSIRRAPTFFFAAILSLSLGIGACAAVFSVFDAVLLRPLPFPEPEQLVMIWEQHRERGAEERRVSPANFVDWRMESKVFQSMGFWPVWQGSDEFNLLLPGGARRVEGIYISSGVFESLLVSPVLGRTFVPTEDAEGGPLAAVLSHELWTSEFNADPNVIGRSLIVDSFRRRLFSIAGVMPRGFSFPGREAVWLSASGMGVSMERRTPAWFRVLARLQSSASPEQASTELNLIQQRIAQTVGDPQISTGAKVISLADELTGRSRRALIILMMTAGIVLLIACANMANLLLARGMSRSREFAVRGALGAPRIRLVGQLLTESMTYAAFAAAAGICIAYGGVQLIRVLGPQDIPRLDGAAVDIRVLGFACFAAMISALLFGTAPAVKLSDSTQADSLKEGLTVSAGRKHAVIRNVFVVTEVALSLMLLIECGLLVRTLINLQRVDPGFQPSGIATARIDLSGSGFSGSRSPGPNRPQAFTRAVLEQVRSLPGVLSAAAVNRLPPFAASFPDGITLERGNAAGSEEPLTAVVRTVTPGYFRTMGAQFRRGRDFTDADDEQAPEVVILNETAARRFFGDSDPLGKQIDIGLASRRDREPSAAAHWHQVVGVVADVKNRGLASDSQPEVYKPDLQWAWHWAYLVVRVEGEPSALLPSLRAELQHLKPAVPVTEVQAMRQALDRELTQPRFRTMLTTLFGGVALVLAMAGVFSLQMYWVGLRMKEFAIRIALGATRGQIKRLATLHGMKWVFLGLALGLAGATILSRGLSSVLYGVEAGDWGTFAISSAILLGVALFSCWIPARRAASSDPISTLRAE